jgi:hypothetical protein
MQQLVMETSVEEVQHPTLTVQLITQLLELELELEASQAFRHGAQKSIRTERSIPLTLQL